MGLLVQSPTRLCTKTLLARVRERCPILMDVVAMRQFDSPFFRLVASDLDIFGKVPPNMSRALNRTYIEGAAKGFYHRPS